MKLSIYDIIGQEVVKYLAIDNKKSLSVEVIIDDDPIVTYVVFNIDNSGEIYREEFSDIDEAVVAYNNL